MALKYAIGSKTFDRPAAESILDSVEGINAALQDIGVCQGQIAEADQVLESLQIALDTISTFGVGEESLGILDSDGSLQAALGLTAPSIESLESMEEKALEALDQKWEKALEAAGDGVWAKIKQFFKDLWDKIVEYAKKFWNWLKGLFGKNKEEAPKAEAAAKTTAAAGVEKQADAVVAASTPEETEKAKTELKEAVQAAPEAKKEAAAKEAAKVEVAAAPAPNTAPCTYKGAMQCCKEYANAMKTYRSILAAATADAKKNWLEIEKELKAAGGQGSLEKMSEKAFEGICAIIRKMKAEADKLTSVGIKVSSNWDVNDPGKLRLTIEKVDQQGANTQLGWNSRKQVQEFIQAWGAVDPNVVSDSIISKVAEDMKKTGDAGTGFAASPEANAIFRKLMYASANFALDLQKLSATITAKLQAQFNWCKAKNALILSAEKAALNA
jgi:hypothetical protein